MWLFYALVLVGMGFNIYQVRQNGKAQEAAAFTLAALLRSTEMSLSSQLQSLRAEQGRLTTAIKDAGERIGQRLSALEHKLSLAGDPDPDIQADIDALRASVEQISKIGGESEAAATEVGAVDVDAVAAEDEAAAESGETDVHEAGGESTVGGETVESEVAVTTTPVEEAADEAAEEAEDESEADEDEGEKSFTLGIRR